MSDVVTESVGAEPIAIIGMACRFPGARDPEAFWRLLAAGEDPIREVPSDRWDVDQHYSKDPSAEGKMVTRWGGFIDQLDYFDNRFFGVSAKEAIRLDPQQRMMLEVAWEAFENAGLPAPQIAGSKTGVFVGSMTSEYAWRQIRDMRLVTAYSPTGSALSILANRLSYVFDLRGPSMSLDTACSSSLVGVTLACRSIWCGESTMALAGGVSAILSPASTIGMSQLTALSSDGRCKTFDARANGYVRSEGAGAVVLKPLSRALADGDPILAVIRGFAVNSDGRTNGLTAPSKPAQQQLLRDAYANASVSPSSVQYIEAHGTGTLLGDPIEAAALGAVVGMERGRLGLPPCLIGAAKASVGHLEGAAGIVGIIKTALMLHKRMIPPSLHFETANPYIPFDKLGLRVATELQPWPPGAPARAGVSAFGFGGTNCHVVLEEAPRASTHHSAAQAADPDCAELLVFSAKSEPALSELARGYLRYLGDAATPALAAVCRTAALRRTHHDHRAFVVGSSAQAMRERIAQLLDSAAQPLCGTAVASRARRPKIAFVYPGLGSQWVGMAQELIASESVFRAKLAEIDTLVRAQGAWSVLEELDGPRAGAGQASAQIEIIQTTLFAVQVGLSALWREWGVSPDAVVGHSMGEVAACHVAGILSLHDAVRVMLARGQLLHASSGAGAMVAAEISTDDAARLVHGHEALVSIAASNSPEATVLSGDSDTLRTIVAALEARGVTCRQVRTIGVAGHGPHLELARYALTERLAGLHPNATTPVQIYSTLTGEAETGARFDAKYWGDQLRLPVRFSTAVERLRENGFSHFVEVSPHPVLAEDIRRCFVACAAEATVLPSLRRKEAERTVLLGTLGRLHALGCEVRLDAVCTADAPVVALPAYPWQRQRFWLDDSHGDDAGEPPRLPDDASLALQRDRWLYEVVWRAVPAATAVAFDARGAWLIISDAPREAGAAEGKARGRISGHDVGAALARRLEDCGGTCTIVGAGDASLIAVALARQAWRGIIHTASLDASSTDLEHAHIATWRSLLVVSQAIGETVSQGMAVAARLWIATAGAQPQPGDASGDAAAVQALSWGFARTFANEIPDAVGAIVDLDPGTSADDAAEALWREITGPLDEDQVVWRGGQRHAARLVRAVCAAKPAPQAALKRAAAYLITGGLGALGLVVARTLASRGARRLILLGRTALPPRATWHELAEGAALADTVQAILALEALGVEVSIEAVDVADLAQLEALIARRRRERRPAIAGVVHAAGIVDDQLLADASGERFAAVLRPKLVGALNLHRIFGRESEQPALDFCVLFSSAASVLGSPGQASYAAGNGVLDALAAVRSANDQPTVSIAWGPWAEIGLAHRPDRGARLGLRGISSFDPAIGAAMFERLLHYRSAPHVVALDADWPVLFDAYAELSDRPLYGELRAQAPARSIELALTLDELNDTAPTLRRDKVNAFLRGLFARSLGCATETVDLHSAMNALGIDSLVVMEITRRTKAALGVAPELSLFARGASIDALGEHLLARVGLLSQTAVSAGPMQSAWILPTAVRPQARARAICFPYAGASPWAFAPLARHLPETMELCTVQLPGRGSRVGEPLATDLAAELPALIAALAPWLDKPFVLFGYSLGGLLAFETARALRSNQLRAPRALVLAASRAPHRYQDDSALRAFADAGGDDARFSATLSSFGGTPKEVLADPAVMARVLPLLRADFALIRNYVLHEQPPLELPIEVFGGTRDPVVPPSELAGWDRYTPHYRLRMFHEAHFFLEPRAKELAQAITEGLTP